MTRPCCHFRGLYKNASSFSKRREKKEPFVDPHITYPQMKTKGTITTSYCLHRRGCRGSFSQSDSHRRRTKRIITKGFSVFFSSCMMKEQLLIHQVSGSERETPTFISLTAIPPPLNQTQRHVQTNYQPKTGNR